MAKVLIIAKLYPAGVEEIELVEKEVRKIKSGEIVDVKREPLAFGMSLIKVGIAVPDKLDGITEKIEAELKKLKGVSEFEIEGVTLI